MSVEGNKNAETHGVYAIRDHGETAMTPDQRSTTAMPKDQLSTREGAIEALKDAAINTIMLAQVAQNYCVEEHRQGKSLDKIALLRSLPAFWNSAGRALKTYLEYIPAGTDPYDAELDHIQQVIDGHNTED